MTQSRDPYEVLGVPRDASTRQIRAAYVARARRAHPDLVGLRGLDVMRALNEAWDILKDDVRKSTWDRENGRLGAPVNAAGPQAHEPAGDRPFWTGAMGRAPGRPVGTVLHFGIYDGWSLGEIARRDRGYLQWLRDRPEARELFPEIIRLLDPDAEEPPDPRQRRRR
ncbi:MAG TPA: DnaJ domain-containing protein [Candidatus Limnocylindrales bacterium]|nr:DnaJ domain-containing protein [Candidatus Limnocylindrales bacterium]